MITTIKYKTTVGLGDGAKLQLEGYADAGEKDIARALRHLVASEYGGDDAGCDYYYDLNEGIVCIAGAPGWWDSRNPLHLKMLETADALDGSDFTFNYAASLAEMTDPL